MTRGNKIELLRFTTAGSVDDGKSTLIGRLLYDSKSIFEDQLKAIEKTSERRGHKSIDLSLLTDGLKDEREQGITIDVAYRYFSTPKRKFIIADSPGHIQYTRNMVTGASTANAALILVDARKGVVEQTKRHSYLASLLQIQHVIVCVNKMDLVEFNEDIYEEIIQSYRDFASKLDIKDFDFIPISALLGDNVVDKSKNMGWYNGPTLLYSLENIPVSNDFNKLDFRFPVQTVIRPKSSDFHDFRGYAGRISSGIVRKNDEVIALPSGLTSKVIAIHGPNGLVDEAFAPMSVSIELEDDLDISRGNLISKVNNTPNISQELDAMICWMDSKPLNLTAKYFIRHTTHEAKCLVKEVVYVMDLNELKRVEGLNNLKMNEIGRVKIKTTQPIIYDSYRKNKTTGSFILVEEGSFKTVASGMII